MLGCCDLTLLYGGSGICSTIGSYAGGVDGYYGTAILKMDANCYSADAFLHPRCGMGMDGDGFWSASMRSSAACVTTSARQRLGNFFCAGKSSVVYETQSDAVLGIYNVRH